MIDGNDEDGFNLICDACGEYCEEFFEDFHEVVAYKQNRSNGWASVKDKNGDWQELGPCCNKADVIADLRGEESVPGSFGLLDLGQLKFEGF